MGVGDFVGGVVDSIFGGGAEDAKKASRKAGASTQLGVDTQLEMFNRAMQETEWLRKLAQPYTGQYIQAAMGQPSVNLPSMRADQDYLAAYDPNNPAAFIRTLYKDVLDMQVPQSSIDYWVDRLQTTGPEQAIQIFKDWRTDPGYAKEYAQYGLKTPPYSQEISQLPTENPQAREILQRLLAMPTQDTQSQDILSKLMGLSPNLNVRPEDLEGDLTYQWQKDQTRREIEAAMSKIGGLNSTGRTTILGNAMTGLTADAVERARALKQQEFVNQLNQLVSGAGQSGNLFGANFGRGLTQLGTGLEGSANLSNTSFLQGLQKFGTLAGMGTQADTTAYQKLLDMLKLSAGGSTAAGSWATGAGANMANLYAGLGQTQAGLHQQVGQNKSDFYQHLFGTGLGLFGGLGFGGGAAGGALI